MLPLRHSRLLGGAAIVLGVLGISVAVAVLGPGTLLKSAVVIPDGSTLTASPASVSTCGGNGSTTLSWTTTTYALYEVRKGWEGGAVLSSGSGNGQLAVNDISGPTSYFLVKVERKNIGGKWQLVRTTVAERAVSVTGCSSPSPAPSPSPSPTSVASPSPAPTPASTTGNVALASNGGRASASSTYPDGRFSVASIIDGNRGTAWAVPEHPGWSDATANQYPDWVQVDFAGQKQINRINVFTLQDNDKLSDPITKDSTFRQWGVLDFAVQYRSGTTWITVPNGSVVNNDKVWREFTFPAVMTDAIRVTISRSLGNPWWYSRIQEVEAWEQGTVPVEWNGPLARITTRNGAPYLNINGTESVPVFFAINSQTVEIENDDWTVFDYEVQKAAQAGMPMLEVHLLRRDPAFITRLAPHVRNFPGSIVLRFALDALPGYIGDPIQFQDAAGNVVAPGEAGGSHYSLSPQWIAAAKAEIRRVLTDANEKIPGKIAGVQFAYLNTGEFFTTPYVSEGRAHYADYSASMADAFCRWTQLPASLVTGCTLPSVQSRLTGNYGVNFLSGDTIEKLRAIVFSRFHSYRVTEAIKELTNDVKAFTNNKALTVVFYGYTNELAAASGLGGSAHTNLAKLLDVRSVDIVASPYSYGKARHLGNAWMVHGPVNAPNVRSNKFWLAEDDTRTHLDLIPCPTGCSGWIAGGSPRTVATLPETLSIVRRNIFSTVLQRGGSYLFDLWGLGWYGRPDAASDSAALWSTISSALERMRAVNAAHLFRPQVAVFMDDVSGDHYALGGLGGSNWGDFSDKLHRDAILELAKTGAPIRTYLVSDLLKDSFPVNEVKLAVFLNTFRMDQAVRQAIDTKLKNSGRTLLFTYAPGLFDQSDNASLAAMASLTGMAIQRGPGNGSLSVTSETNGIYPGLAGTTYGPTYGADPWFYVPEGVAEVVGRYAQSQYPALTFKDFGTHRVVFSGAPGMTANIYRAIAQHAGVHMFTSQAGDIVEANNDAVMVHTNGSRLRTITFPVQAGQVFVDSNGTESLSCSNCSQVSMPMTDKGVYLFRLTGGSTP